MANKHDDHHDLYHVAPLGNYFKIFGALLVFTFLTVMAAGRFGSADVVVAMAIATVKAALVMLFFMHLKYDNMMNRVIIGCGFFFLTVLFFFTSLDLFTRVDGTPK